MRAFGVFRIISLRSNLRKFPSKDGRDELVERARGRTMADGGNERMRSSAEQRRVRIEMKKRRRSHACAWVDVPGIGTKRNETGRNGTERFLRGRCRGEREDFGFWGERLFFCYKKRFGIGRWFPTWNFRYHLMESPWRFPFEDVEIEINGPHFPVATGHHTGKMGPVYTWVRILWICRVC